jgi:resuscitation-promoting factor RpfA
VENPVLSSATPARAGRHRAPRRPGRLGRAGLALVAAGAPVIPAALLAAPAAHAETDWDALAECESGGDWSINTGNGFGGGLQFTDSTWSAFGGSGQPEDAGRAEQIRVAERVKAEQGMNAWPTCSRKTGQTDDSPNSSVPSGSSGSSESSESSSEASESAGDEDSESTETRTVSDTGSSGAGSYTVKAGDTLSSIAAAHGASWRSLAQANPDIATDPDLILPGQTLAMA